MTIALVKTPSPRTFDEWDWARSDFASSHKLESASDSAFADVVNDLVGGVADAVAKSIPHGETAVAVLREFADDAEVELGKVGVVELSAFGGNLAPADAGDTEVVMSFDLGDALTTYLDEYADDYVPNDLRSKWSEYLRGLAERIDALKGMEQ